MCVKKPVQTRSCFFPCLAFKHVNLWCVGVRVKSWAAGCQQGYKRTSSLEFSNERMHVVIAITISVCTVFLQELWLTRKDFIFLGWKLWTIIHLTWRPSTERYQLMLMDRKERNRSFSPLNLTSSYAEPHRRSSLQSATSSCDAERTERMMRGDTVCVGNISPSRSAWWWWRHLHDVVRKVSDKERCVKLVWN